MASAAAVPGGCRSRSGGGVVVVGVASVAGGGSATPVQRAGPAIAHRPKPPPTPTPPSFTRRVPRERDREQGGCRGVPCARASVLALSHP